LGARRRPRAALGASAAVLRARAMLLRAAREKRRGKNEERRACQGAEPQRGCAPEGAEPALPAGLPPERAAPEGAGKGLFQKPACPAARGKGMASRMFAMPVA